MFDPIIRVVRPLALRLANMISRAVVRGVDDTAQIQALRLALLDGEERGDVERPQPYGFSSVPRAGAEAVVIFVGGRRDHGLAIAVEDRRYRIRNLESGEVAVYNDTGAKIVFKANGDVEVTPKAGQKFKIAADVDVTGTLTASVDVVGGGKSLKTHTHASGTLSAPAGGGPVTGSTGGPS